MVFRNMFLKYYDEAGAAGGGADEPVKTYTQAEVDEMTRGLKESRDALLSELAGCYHAADSGRPEDHPRNGRRYYRCWYSSRRSVGHVTTGF